MDPLSCAAAGAWEAAAPFGAVAGAVMAERWRGADLSRELGFAHGTSRLRREKPGRTPRRCKLDLQHSQPGDGSKMWLLDPFVPLLGCHRCLRSSLNNHLKHDYYNSCCFGNSIISEQRRFKFQMSCRNHLRQRHS